MRRHNFLHQIIVGFAFAAVLLPAFAQKKYDPGASDTEFGFDFTWEY